MTIRDGHLGWARKEDTIKNEELLDGISVIRTREPAARVSAADGVRLSKRLALVEQAFRCLKGIDLLVRPSPHRPADRVRAHLLLCLLAYYVQWPLRPAWEPLLFEDEELAVDRQRRDPVAPARLGVGAAPEEDTPDVGRSAGPELSDVAGSSGDALPEHVWGDRRSQPDDVPPGEGGRCVAGRGAAVDHGGDRNGHRESP